MIEVKNLYKSFEDKDVLKNINTVFEDGKTNLIIGRSGSGKTVLMKNLVGLLDPTSGQVLYDGRDFVKMSKHEKVMMRREMGMIFQSAALFDSLTVLENVKQEVSCGTMEDSHIIELYWQREEQAIKESQMKYGGYCSTIADNILHSAEDSEECVNDTWFRAWNTMPPEKPNRLVVFFGRITRNLAIDRYRSDTSKKRGEGQMALCLDELAECIGEDSPIEDRLALREVLNRFLRELPDKNRTVFLLRYWYMMPVSEIAKRYDLSEGAVKMLLQRARNKLKDYLEKEGVAI